jgi:pimeloyl-ACP methyl ester carboxylesterase
MPGSGSDAEFAAKAFGPALREAANADIVAVQPYPAGVMAGYRRALEEAAARGPVLACGISLGAVAAAQFALDRPEATAGILAVMPPWTGEGSGAPSKASASWSAAQMRERGIAPVAADMAATSPRWLAAELTRSWAAHGALLPQALDEAAACPAPTLGELRAIAAPVGIVTATDDPVHPSAVAREWHAAIPAARLAETTLAAIGADPSIIGRLALSALRRSPVFLQGGQAVEIRRDFHQL